jgi:YidC/Oxa1 family membrane protein insertase
VVHLLRPLIDSEEWLLERLHSIGLGWGLAIVGLTLLVRVCTLPLVMRQFKSQREMRRHMPELRALRDRHKKDPQRLREETLEYYRRHGINPLASFAPLLIQIPVFISLYYLMRTDVKSGLFGDDGFLFIPDLGIKPHGAVLVALLLSYLVTQTATSLIATRTLQGGQRGLMLALPLLFASVITRVPAGLAVYWLTTSLWSLGQQLVFWRAGPAGLPALVPEPAPAAAAAAPPPARRQPQGRRRKKKRRR